MKKMTCQRRLHFYVICMILLKSYDKKIHYILNEFKKRYIMAFVIVYIKISIIEIVIL